MAMTTLPTGLLPTENVSRSTEESVRGISLYFLLHNTATQPTPNFPITKNIILTQIVVAHATMLRRAAQQTKDFNGHRLFYYTVYTRTSTKLLDSFDFCFYFQNIDFFSICQFVFLHSAMMQWADRRHSQQDFTHSCRYVQMRHSELLEYSVKK